ncbi:MAG: gamma-glutamyltransferase [Gammaproteobacteria bacterium]
MHRLFFTVVVFLLSVNTMVAAALPPHSAIASAHPVATQAGLDIIQQGGNAFDAAITVSATLAVVEPYSSGMGGGGFWLLHREADKKQVMIDGRERAPLKAHRNMYLDTDGNVIAGLSVDGPLAAGIPGEPAALAHIAKHYGRLSLQKTLAPAIRAAREGFAVTVHYQRMAKFRLDALRASPEAARIFLHNNEVPPLGHLIKQPELASTLERLATKGERGFYQGTVAKQMIEGVQAAGGIWTYSDLNSYGIAERTPLMIEYQGHRIVTAPPPSSGGVAMAQIFNQLSLLEATSKAEPLRTHLIIEAMRRAYRDRSVYLGDADFVAVPVARLVGREHAQTMVRDIDPEMATLSHELPGGAEPGRGFHTTHFSILDKEGNRVSATLSINYPFGSGFVVPGTGVLLNDEMDDFSAKPGTPNVYGLVGADANAIAPGKRMLSSMSPSFVEGPDRVALIGTPGGSRIITMVLLGIQAFIEGHDAERIVTMPRFHHQYLPDQVQMEAEAFSREQQQQLHSLGHILTVIENGFGNMQLVTWNKSTASVSAASDPRGEGMARVE